MDQCLGDTTPDEVLIPMQTDGSFLMSDDRVREPLLAASKRAMNTTSQTAIYLGTKRCTIESLDYEYHAAFVAYVGCNLLLATVAAALCAYITFDRQLLALAYQVKAYLNGVDSHSILAPSTLLVKIFGSIFGVSAGFVLGKEGPMVHTGACVASLLSQGTILGPISDLDPAIFALLGAASLLGGTMRMTVSVCVILLELTDDLLMLPLVMLVLLISKSVADNFNIGVYDLMIQMKGLPYLEAHAEPYMRHLVAHDVVSGPLLTFFGVEKVGNIIQILKTTGHHGFPVINEPPFSEAPELCGLVLRSHLIVLLKGKRFTKDKVLTGSTEVFKSFGSFDFAKAGPGKGMKLEELEISADEMEMYVDLHPITNKSPYTVVETMSLAKAALLFRELGLRHLFVVPKTPGKPPVVGILTRPDFMREHILGLFPHFNQRKKMNEEQT
ncbi:hypothetical protein J5N97_020113 [Dioscorea zingiberensis]|uniref:CBS domain-containing protein n=1 Tax=Dioscorea zingiberensis TaxID=325984 RepID=A0A9D5HD43_9LILI|nr:hypothetical protein J5N97_020113 [Dioscorea zingiberensis]